MKEAKKRTNKELMRYFVCKILRAMFGQFVPLFICKHLVL